MFCLPVVIQCPVLCPITTFSQPDVILDKARTPTPTLQVAVSKVPVVLVPTRIESTKLVPACLKLADPIVPPTVTLPGIVTSLLPEASIILYQVLLVLLAMAMLPLLFSTLPYSKPASLNIISPPPPPPSPSASSMMSVVASSVIEFEEAIVILVPLPDIFSPGSPKSMDLFEGNVNLLLSVMPVSGLCVIVVSWSLPK